MVPNDTPPMTDSECDTLLERWNAAIREDGDFSLMFHQFTNRVASPGERFACHGCMSLPGRDHNQPVIHSGPGQMTIFTDADGWRYCAESVRHTLAVASDA